MKDLTEAELIEIGNTARQLAALTADYNNYGARQSWSKKRRKNARCDMEALGAEVAEDVENLIEHLRAFEKEYA